MALFENGKALGGTVELIDTSGKPFTAQNPIPADGDSVYVKDIDLDNSDNGNFSGSVSDYFNDLKTINLDTTGNNPKTIKVWFERTVYSHSIGLGCDNLTKGFGTSVTVKLLGSGEVVRFTKAFTNLDPNSALMEFGPKAFNGFILEFNTSSEVCVSNITIQKSVQNQSTLQGLSPTGEVVSVLATGEGRLDVSTGEGLAISQGLVPGKTSIHKYGTLPQIADSGDGFLPIWDDPAGTKTYIFPTSNTIDSLSSSDTGDTMDVEVEGVYELTPGGDRVKIIQQLTLTGQTVVNLPQPLLGSFRMKVLGMTTPAGTIYCFESSTAGGTTAGVPNTATSIKAAVVNGNNQTKMAIFWVRDDADAYLNVWDVSILKSGTVACEGRITLWEKNTLPRDKGSVGLNTDGTSIGGRSFDEPEKLPAGSIVYLELKAVNSTDIGASGFLDIVEVDK